MRRAELTAVTAVTAAFACAACVTTRAPQVGADLLAAPAPTAMDEGAPTLEARLKGKVAVVDLWASWCEPCKKGIPRLKQLAAHYKNEGLVVVGVNVGEPAAMARTFCESAGIDYPVYLDDDYAFSDALGERNVPALLLVNRRGQIVHRATEVDATLLEHVAEALKTTPPAPSP